MATPVTYDLELIAGKPWALTCRYLLPADPTTGVRAPGIPDGYLVRAAFWPTVRGTEPLIVLDPTPDYTTGSFDLSLLGTQTAELPSLGAWYLELNDPSGAPSLPLAEGRVNVAPW